MLATNSFYSTSNRTVVFGSNLGLTAVPQGDWPTTLGGAGVTICGFPAQLSYVSAGQINALVPDRVQAGPCAVVVTVNGRRSAASSIVITAEAWGVFRAVAQDIS